MYTAVYVIVVFAGLAMTVREGLWSNTITLTNIVISGLVAFGFYSPITTWLDVQLSGEWTYVLDYFVVWAIFVATMVLLRYITGAASRTRMRFRHPIDPVGGPAMGLIAAWVLASFVLATLHMVPMPKDAFGGKLVHSVADVNGGKSALMAPDLGWLRFVERMSNVTAYGAGGSNRFSAAGFVAAYMGHRASLEKATTKYLNVKRG
jgi:hypothetical protein